jgi:hypothetical protein
MPSGNGKTSRDPAAPLFQGVTIPESLSALSSRYWIEPDAGFLGDDFGGDGPTKTNLLEGFQTNPLEQKPKSRQVFVLAVAIFNKKPLTASATRNASAAGINP